MQVGKRIVSFCIHEANLSPAPLFAMSVPNLIGVCLLLPIVRSELARFVAFSKRVDGGATVEEADAVDRGHHS